MFKICIENRLTLRDNDYKCYLCHCKISKNSFDEVLMHISLNEHINKMNQINKTVRKQESEKLSTITETKRRRIVQNQITCLKSAGLFKCHICKFQIIGLTNVIEHIKDALHIKQAKIINKRITEFQDNLLQSNSSVEKIKDSKTVSKPYNQSKETTLQSCFTEMHYCVPCHVHLKNATILQCHVMLHLHRDYNLPSESDILKFSFTAEKCIIKCLLCNLFISNNELLYEHLKTSIHLDRLQLLELIGVDLESNGVAVQLEENVGIKKKFDSTKDLLIVSHCTLCDITLPKKHEEDHIKNEKHSKSLSRISKTDADKTCCERIELDTVRYYTCFICQSVFCNVEDLMTHYQTDEHRHRIKSFQIIYNSPHIHFTSNKNKQIIYCSLCRTDHHDSSSAIKHILDERHKKDSELFFEKRISSNKKSSMTINVNMKKQIISTKESSKDKIMTINEKKSNFQISTKRVAGDNREFSTSPEKMVKLGFDLQNMKSLITNESGFIHNTLNDLTKLNLNESQHKQCFPSNIKKKHRTPDNRSKRNSLFENNVLKFGKDYIISCIDPGPNNIYNIDHEKISLMKLGVMLTIPWKSEPFCLPCGLQLPDNKQFLFEHLKNQEHNQNLLEMKINDKDFEKFPDQYSDLKLAKSYMKEISENIIQCFVCNLEIENEHFLIHSHSNNANHIVKSKIWAELSNNIISNFTNIMNDIWYYAQVFECKICQRKFDFEIDFVIHLQNVDHLKNIDQLKSINNVLQFDGCPVCITYWLGESNSYSFHCEDQFHKHFANNGNLMVPEMTTDVITFLDNVEEKVHHLVGESNRVANEKQKESDLLLSIKNTVESAFSKVQPYIIGSRCSNLALADDNVDVFLDCENVYYKSTTQEQNEQYISSVRKYFENEPNIWIINELLLVTKVPVMKLLHIPTGLKCEISFSNGLSVEKSKLIRSYCAAYKTCQKLILYLKSWLKLCQIFGPDCITTSAISWYVIFYLQIKGILPTVHSLMKHGNEQKLVDGWECGFIKTIQARNSDENFKEHLRGFFSYYADFDYHKNVACPYLGKIIEKRDYAFIDQLSTEMKIYKDRLMNNGCSVFRFESPMCIQDPVDLSQNMTKAVKKQQLLWFRHYCKKSFEKL